MQMVVTFPHGLSSSIAPPGLCHISVVFGSDCPRPLVTLEVPTLPLPHLERRPLAASG